MKKKFKQCKHQLESVGLVKVACKCQHKKGQNHEAFKCDLRGRCIPTFRGPWQRSQIGVESRLYTLCHARKGRCPDYET